MASKINFEYQGLMEQIILSIKYSLKNIWSFVYMMLRKLKKTPTLV
jgi:hypothetical protein